MYIETRPWRSALLLFAALGVLSEAPALAARFAGVDGGWENTWHGSGHDGVRPTLVLIGQAAFPTGMPFKGTTVGGLSGIDYAPRHDRFAAISDDRSDIDDARFYQLSIDLSDGDVELLSVITIRDERGAPFAPKSVDPESIRIAPDGGSLYWSSEGDASALILVSNNNFSTNQVTQFLAFKLVE